MKRTQSFLLTLQLLSRGSLVLQFHCQVAEFMEFVFTEFRLGQGQPVFDPFNVQFVFNICVVLYTKLLSQAWASSTMTADSPFFLRPFRGLDLHYT